LERGWGLLLPEFRGPNLTVNPRATQACASPLAQQDVLDALEATIALGAVDTNRIFLLGASGGGHMALMMAANSPHRWLGVSSWVPITDLAAWHAQNPKYAPHIAACCGGPPGSNEAVDAQYHSRSPLFLAQQLAAANLSVHHGRFDASVPYSHTTDLAAEVEMHEPERFFYEIFDGGHEIRYDVAFRWFDALLSNRRQATATG
jgi:dipeptidyl aminopeptidase/acylaminoacyl peptidase